MACQKCRLNWDGEFFLKGADHPQHFQLCFSRQTISALDFDGSRTGAHGLLQSVAGISEQLRFGHNLQRTGRIQDSTSFCCDFLVTLAFKAAQKLPRAARSKHQVRVAVAPRWKDILPFAIDHLQPTPIGDTREVVHRTEVDDNAVLNGQPRPLQHRQGPHLPSFQIQRRRIVCTHQSFDVLPEHSHGRKVAIPARVP